MRIKKIVSILLSMLIAVSMMPMVAFTTEIEAASDIQGPIFHYIKLNKTQFHIGDTIVITAGIYDDTAVNDAFVVFLNDSSRKEIHFDNVSGETFNASILIDESFLCGDYCINYVSAEDTLGNISEDGTFYDVKFTVLDNNSEPSVDDNNLPEIKSFVIDKSSVKPGDSITITSEITDESGVQNALVLFANPAGTSHQVAARFTHDHGDLYTATLDINDTFHEGTYNVEYIYLEDTMGNNGYNYSFSNEQFIYTEDASSTDDDTDDNNAVKGVIVYKNNTSISDQTIVGDVYIGPNAVVTLSNVTVSGNIYVLGGATLSNVTASGIYGSSMYFGSSGSTYLNGTIYLNGSNSFGSLTSSSTPITDIPVEIVDNEATSIDGKLQIKGATLDIADFYIAGNKVDLSDDGIFLIKDIEIGDAESVTLKWITVFGNTIEKNVKVVKLTKDENGVVHHIPEITVSDITACIGQDIDLLKNVKATDYEDGDITKSITVSPAAVSSSSAGITQVTYSIADSNGARVEKIINVIVNPHHYGVWTTTKYPICDETGEKEKVCANCGDRVTEEIPAGNHDLYFMYANNATCTSPGNIEFYRCKICGDYFKDPRGLETVTEKDVSIPVLDHNLNEIKFKHYSSIWKCSQCGKYFVDKDGTQEHNDSLGWKTLYQVVKGAKDSFENGLYPEYSSQIVQDAIAEGERVLNKGMTRENIVLYYNTADKLTDIFGQLNDITIGNPVLKLSVTEFTYKYKVQKIKVKKKKKTVPVGTVQKPLVTSVTLNGKTISANNYDVTYSNEESADIGTYTVTVTLKGAYSGKGTATYTINPKRVNLKKVAKGKKKFTASWKKLSKNDIKYKVIGGYQLRYSTNPTFPDGNTKVIKAGTIKSAKKAVSKLQAKTKYYVQLRTYKTVSGVTYYSNWSATKVVVTK